jgi:hypothetical protein
LKRVLMAGLLTETVAMGLLAGSEPVQSESIDQPMLLVDTGPLGLGLGLTLGSISTYAGAFIPQRRDVAPDRPQRPAGAGHGPVREGVAWWMATVRDVMHTDEARTVWFDPCLEANLHGADPNREAPVT